MTLLILSCFGIWLTFFWLVHLKTKNAAWADVAWASSFSLLVFIAFVQNAILSLSWLIFYLCLVLWSLRLTLHLLKDRVWRKPEESRYQALRAVWKTNWALKSFGFFQAQALVAWVLACPFWLLSPESSSPNLMGFSLAAGLFGLSFALEALADKQLKRFKQGAHRGAICQEGLWNYSRHPNYFFEILIWISFALMSISLGAPLLALLSPALMSTLIIFVTGVKPSEKQSLKSRGQAYRQYQETTSMLIPWPKSGMNKNSK